MRSCTGNASKTSRTTCAATCRWAGTGTPTIVPTSSWGCCAGGFEPSLVDGANLFWRWLQIPALLGGARLRAVLGRAIYLDGVLFKSANLFVAARRSP